MIKKLTSITLSLYVCSGLLLAQEINPVYLDSTGTDNTSIYIQATGYVNNSPSMLFHLPYVGTTGNSLFEFDGDDSGTRRTIFRFKTSGDNIFEMRGWSDGAQSDLWFGDQNNDKFFISSTGNVGIGTANPDEALTVKGKIHAEEVIVNLNVPGPDYVFEEDYDLPTLDELESFITANKHLPEVPSAAEMEEEGIVLGDMNMLLLKKIEELTLYAIALQKTIDQGQKTEEELTRKLGEQQKTNNDQQGTINELIKRIEALETAINEQ